MGVSQMTHVDRYPDAMSRFMSIVQQIMETCQLCEHEMKTYRTEPIPGAKLGGTQCNPEDYVVDEIDRLVDQQLEQGEGW
jgi:hypothetical protein